MSQDRLWTELAEIRELLSDVEGCVDEQTYDEHRKADFEKPDDAEISVNLPVAIERKLSKACGLLESIWRRHERENGRDPDAERRGPNDQMALR